MKNLETFTITLLCLKKSTSTETVIDKLTLKSLLTGKLIKDHLGKYQTFFNYILIFKRSIKRPSSCLFLNYKVSPNANIHKL